MARAHPYEEVAYDVYPLHTQAEHALGRIGALPKPMLASELRDYLAERLGNPYVRVYGKPSKVIHTLAVGGGSGGDYLPDAQQAHLRALCPHGYDHIMLLASAAEAVALTYPLTGEVRHHHTWEAWARDVVLLEGGHAETEQPGVVRLAQRLREYLAPRNVEVFVEGSDG